MSIASESNGSAQPSGVVPGSVPASQKSGASLIAGLKIPSPVIAAATNLFSAGVSPDIVVKELTKVLSKTYDPATAKAMAEKAVFDALKSPGGTKALFDAKIANGKDPQQVKAFISNFVQQYGNDPELMNQLTTYVKNLDYDSYVKMGVVDPGKSGQESSDKISDFLLDSLDGLPDGGIDSAEAETLAQQKTTPHTVKDAETEMREVSGLAIHAKLSNEDSLKNAKSDLKQDLIDRGYSTEDAEVLADKLMANLVLGENNLISDDVALIVYNHVSGSAAQEIPAELGKSVNSVNTTASNLTLFLELTGAWTQDNQELKQQLKLETIDSIPGALSFGVGVASDVGFKLDSITAPGPDGGSSKLDAAYEEGVSHWRTLVEASGTEAVKQMLMNDYGVSAEDANNFIIFLTSSVANETGVIPDSIKQIIDNEGSGGVALYNKVGMYNKQIDVYTEKLDSFDTSLRSELEALGVPTEVLDKFTTAELTDPNVQAQIAEESGVELNSIIATTNGAEVVLRIDVGTIEQETYVASLQQQQLENQSLFNAGVISKEEYDDRTTDITTRINQTVQSAENYQSDLRKMLDLFIQIISMHP